MITIPVYVSGDQWNNPKDVESILAGVPHDAPIALDLCAEGPSLEALGVLDMLRGWCAETKRDTSQIYLTHWSNNVESVEFTRIDRSDVSHFFWMCENYITDIEPLTHEKRFGMFIGRRSISRMFMLWDVWCSHQESCIFSLMDDTTPYNPLAVLGRSLDTVQEWIPQDKVDDFLSWCRDTPINSIDGHVVSDQYDPHHNTNRDLLSHYHRFDIEIVIETYTRGVCFLPTEKTVRPLTAAKPVLVHGPRDFLKRMRNLGFRTWHEYWDESYDRLEGAGRWHALRRVIDDLAVCDLPREIFDIAEYNRQHHLELMSRHRPL